MLDIPVMYVCINFFSSSIVQMLAEDSSPNDSFLLSDSPFAEISRMLDSESEDGSLLIQTSPLPEMPATQVSKDVNGPDEDHRYLK